MSESILNRFRLDGKVALVTGAATGLGQGIACGLAEAGARTMLIDADHPDETLRLISSKGGAAIPMTRNLSGLHPDQAEEIVGEAIQAMGGLDIVVNNAGIIRRESALDFSKANWEEVLDLNLSSSFYMAQAAAKSFVEREQQGKIIFMASMMSFQGGINVPSYAASKSAIAGVTRALANEWASHGINVNAIAPGYFVSGVTAGIREDPERSQAILDRIPAGRWGRPDDLKGMAVFLASEASNYVHGAILPVDGGWLTG